MRCTFWGAFASLLLVACFSFTALAEEHAAGLSPDQALKRLQDGNLRFTTGTQTRMQSDVQRARELVDGQKPYAIILSCSDSRVSPEILFDEGLGQLFVVRVAGNVIGAAETASIEYAVEHLGAHLIVVVGHNRCGAVKAAVNTKYGASGPTEDLTALIANIHKNLGVDLERYAEEQAKDPALEAASVANAAAVVKALQDRSRVVFEGVKSKTLKVVAALYHLESGKVEFISEKRRLR